MKEHLRISVLIIILPVLSLFGTAGAQVLKTRPKTVAPVPQNPREHANNDPVYLKLRGVALQPDALNVTDFSLRREAGVFHFQNGEFYMLEPVNGKVSGAVFLGEATLTVTPPTAVKVEYK